MQVTIQRLTELTDELRDEMVRLWMTVNDAGGGVGFMPGAAYAEVAQALAKHEASMQAGRAWLHVMRDKNNHELLGFAWWVVGLNHDATHIATIKRLQIKPSLQGSGLGRVLMDYLHTPEVLNDLVGVDFLHLQYRAGLGLGKWYASYGYEHIARFDLFRKKGVGNYGGWNEMMRSIDGSPLPELQL